MSDAELATLRTEQLDYDSGSLSSESPANNNCLKIEDSKECDKFSPQFSCVTSQAQVGLDPQTAVPQPDLIRACQEGDLKSVKQLLNKENINTGALHHAASNNQWQVCQFLIDQGADIHARIEPLNATPLLWACRNGHAYIVKLLIDHGADISVVDSSGFTALHLAVHSSNVLMVAYVCHLELNVDRPDFGNRTSLHWALVQGDHLSVEVLLKSGASSNLCDGEGASPLALAVNTAKSELCTALLLDNSADPKGIDFSAGVPPVWTQTCRKSGRLPNGQLRRSKFLSAESAKILTFVVPVLLIPTALSMPRIVGSSWLGIPLALFLSWLSKRGLEKYVIPYGWKGPKAILQSTLLAGAFASIFGCATFFWFSQISFIMLQQRPWSSWILIACAILVAGGYIVTMFMDPGKIEPKSMAKRLTSMNELIDKGLFDSVHFCVHTYVSIPTRARYDFYLDRVVCRYDHYCPWLYNTIGLRNHRVFLIFVIALSLAIPIAGVHYVEYCDQVGVSSFGVGLSILILVQSLWIYVLCLVQLMQIARGATSHEVSNFEDLKLYQTDPIQAYSSLPRDHPRATAVLGTMSSASSLLKYSTGSRNRKPKRKYNLFLRLTGFSQVIDAWHMFKQKDRIVLSDNGVSRNCADFWLSGGNVLNPTGTYGRLDGSVVDYSTLMYADTAFSETV